MNIVHILLSGGLGGIEALCRDINSFSNENNIFYFVYEGGAIYEIIKNSGSKTYIANESHNDFIGTAKRFVKFCKNNNADVVISHHGSPICRYLLAYTKKHYKKVRCLLYLHSDAHISFHPNKFKQIINKKLILMAHKASDITVAISQTVKKSFVDIYDFEPEKTKVVYNGTQIEKFYHNDKKDDAFNIIFVGRIVPIKGIHLLIEAAAKLDFDFRVDIFGKCTDEEYGIALKNMIEKYKLDSKVFLNGPKVNVENYLANADLFVHPVICDEGFGITLIEAMAAGVPCVAFNKGAISEIIDDGIDGLTVNDTTADALAQKITQAYNIYKSGVYASWRDNARKKASKFTIQNTVSSLENLYQQR